MKICNTFHPGKVATGPVVRVLNTKQLLSYPSVYRTFTFSDAKLFTKIACDIAFNHINTNLVISANTVANWVVTTITL